MPKEAYEDAGKRRSLADLQDELAADLRPVRRFHPGRLTAWVVALGFGLGLGILWPMMGLRGDAVTLGPLWLWGPAIFGVALGAVLIVLALRQLVPGNLPPTSLLIGGALVGFVLCALIYVAVYSQSQTPIPSDKVWQVALFCLGMEICLGLPAVLLFFWLARRGFTANPVLPAVVGAAGVVLVADSVWRMMCKFSEPAHVISSHLPGMAVVVLAAGLLAHLWDRRRLRGQLRAGGLGSFRQRP